MPGTALLNEDKSFPHSGCGSVSVIIPCRDYAAFVGQAIASVLDQSYTATQVIVIDDGSTDSSRAVVQAFGERVTLIALPGKGAAAARNVGLAAAKGDLIAFLDADDLWTPDSLLYRVKALQASPLAPYAYGQMEQFICDSMPREMAAKIVSPAAAVVARMPSALLVRRSAIDRIGRFNESFEIGEAIDFVDRLDQLGSVPVAVEQLVARRRIHGKNSMIRQKDNHAGYLRVLSASIRRHASGRAD